MDYATEKLGAEVMFEIDADFQHDPHATPEFISKIDEGFDFVIGSRYIKGGSIPSNWGLKRKVFSIIGNLIVRGALTNISVHDWTSGYRAIKSWVYKKVRDDLAQYNGYTFQVAFLHKAIESKAKIVEVPIQFGERKYGKSKIGGEYIKNLLLYLIHTRIRFIKFLIVGTIGFIVNTIGLEGFIYLGLRPSLAGAAGAELAIFSNFTLNNLWTFKENKITSVKQIPVKFLIFNAASFGSVVIQAITIEIGSRLFGVELYRLYFIIGVGIGLIWNYVMYNRVVWKTHKTDVK